MIDRIRWMALATMQLQIRLHIRLVVALVFLGAMPTAVFETVGSAFGIAAAADESTAAADVDNARLDFFETRIRPVLIEHCYGCHSADAKSVKGGLLLDSREATLAGGDSGAAIVPGDPEQSLLLQAIQHTSFEMPPDRKLPDNVARDFEKWIREGAVDPRRGTVVRKASGIDIEKGRQFWSFQPVNRPVVPQLNGDSAEWGRNDIDAFVAAVHDQHRVHPVPDATPEQLIRRLYFVLIGLPPTPDQVETFAAAWQRNQDAAVSQAVDELLESRHFGERWGRHWLDVARFAESSGGGRSLMYPHAWRFRDYVIRSFNNDKPFDQFVREQIAGDLLPAETDAQRDDQVIGSGYLIMGAINFEQQDKEALRMDVIDEQIDSVGRTFLGMTLGCARCHDHKFDPVPATDYYALAGIFRSTHTLTPGNVSGYVTTALRSGYDPRPMEEWEEKDRQLKTRIEKQEAELGAKPNSQGEVISAASLSGVVVDDDLAEFKGEWTSSTSLRPFVGAGYRHSGHAKTGVEVRYSVRLPMDGKFFVRLSHDFSDSRSAAVPVTVYHADGSSTIMVNQTERPNVDGVFTALGEFHFSANNPAVVIIDAKNAAPGYVIADAVQFVPADQPENSRKKVAEPSEASTNDNQDRREDLGKLRKQLTAHQKVRPAVPVTMCVEDEAQPGDWHVHLRGDAHRLGDLVPRGFLTVATPVEMCKQQSAAMVAAVADIPAGSSGRLQLANWLASTSNPLTSRVFVNRVWMHLLGEGLVRNPDNFGATGFPPTHPQLLDYLAATFVEDDLQSVKKLIRRICNSRTFRMSSTATTEQLQVDPDNNLLTRANRRRLDAETLRDSVLQISGQLDLSVNEGSTIGRLSTYDNGYIHENYPLNARSVFVPFFRNAMLDLFFVFDVANPNMVTGRRTTGTLPAQSLFLMNSPFVADQAQFAADRFLSTASKVQGKPDELTRDQLIDDVWRLTLSRRASAAERQQIRLHLQQFEPTSREAWAEIFHAIFGSVDFRYVD